MRARRKTRVLHVGPECEGRGGMAAVLRDLRHSPLAAEREFRFLTTWREGHGRLRAALLFAAALLSAARWALRPGPKVAHVHTAVRGSWYRKAVVVWVLKALGAPVVLHIHSGAVDIHAFWNRIGARRRALIARGFALSDRVLSVSDAGAAALRELMGLEVLVVRNAAPAIKVVEPAEAAPGAVVRVLYLGGFANAAKGGAVLAEALPGLLARPGTRVVLAGPGTPPPELAPLLGERLAWRGWLDEADKARELGAADIVVFPSISEGLPVALLEAMSAGRAIVATRTGGMPEVLTDGEDALLVAPGDPAALADALRRLAADPELRRELAGRAAERAGRLNHDEVYGRLERLYDELSRPILRAARPAGPAMTRPRVLLVCSPGGHLQQMLALRPAWDRYDVTWATLAGRDVEHLLAGERVVLAHGPTNRSVAKLLRNLPLAWRTLRRLKPDAVLSTGAGPAVPFFLVGRLLGVRLVYVESLTRTERMSLSGRLVTPLAHEIFVQWPQPAARHDRARYVGSILDRDAGAPSSQSTAPERSPVT